MGLGRADGIHQAHRGTADPRTVAALRRILGAWLDRYLELGEERRADIVLAADEAMSNCADHAYGDDARAGDVTLRITYNPVSSELMLRIGDHGHWTEPAPPETTDRGRGIQLMRAMADECVIDGRAEGTAVCLRFFECPPAGYLASQYRRAS